MDRISQIIKEEIEKYILNENINSLTAYGTNLTNSLNRFGNDLTRVNNNIDARLKKYLKEFETYIIQIIHAINRCVNANNLNEAFSFSDFGLEVPPELGGNFWNDGVRGYYKTKNFFTRGRGNANIQNNSRVNQNTVQSVKLSVLLQNLQQKQNEFANYDAQFGISNISQQPKAIFQNILPNLKREYDMLIQQQSQPQQNQQQPTP